MTSAAPSPTRWSRPTPSARDRVSVLVLSGGPTARQCYEVLATAAGIDWDLVDVYVGDERVVPPDHVDANQRLIREALLDRVGGVGSFSPMPTVGPIDECVASYQRTMERLLSGPGIDLIHLGMGPDGHTASLFPGTASLGAPPGVWVLATEDTGRHQRPPTPDAHLAGHRRGPIGRVHRGGCHQGGGGGRPRAWGGPPGGAGTSRTDRVVGRWSGSGRIVLS